MWTHWRQRISNSIQFNRKVSSFSLYEQMYIILTQWINCCIWQCSKKKVSHIVVTIKITIITIIAHQQIRHFADTVHVTYCFTHSISQRRPKRWVWVYSHAVPSCEITMDELEVWQVSHSLCNLNCKTDQLLYSRLLQCQQYHSDTSSWLDEGNTAQALTL